MSCRICSAPTVEVLDLGASPPANWLASSPTDEHPAYPLVLEWCETCHNVQLRDTLPPGELYRDYLYVTPRSEMLHAHYQDLSRYLSGNGLIDDRSFVVEAGSNVGLFLDHLRPMVGQVLGVDPAEAIAQMAVDAGVPTICDYFGADVVDLIRDEHRAADLVVARHCLAHNPSPHDMVAAAARLMADDGALLVENAYILNTIENTEFDQVYHEHMFYFSIGSMRRLLQIHGLTLVDVLMSLVHGGSIIFIARKGGAMRPGSSLASYEPREAHYLNRDAFAAFAQRTAEIRRRLVELLGELRVQGRTVHTYGATAKGNTLLNYTGLTSREIPLCVDSTPMKQGRYLPGSRIRIISEEEAASDPADDYLLTAWNYQDEIIGKVRAAGNYRSRFVIPIPFVRTV